MNSSNSVITLTFGETAENHVGMEKIGTLVPEGQGFSITDLQEIKESIQTLLNVSCELYTLNTRQDQEPAAVLVIRNGVNAVLSPLGKTKQDLFQEQMQLDQDKKALMYGRVVNKNARWNLCFDDVGHEPTYEEGKGRVIPYDEVPLTKFLKEVLGDYFGPKAEKMKCEGNYYYDIQKCGIGFHGDSERRRVIGVRLGGSMDMHYQWFQNSEPVGDRIQIPLQGGDIYMMSEKAVGTDWKMRSIPTLRHATGCQKFTAL